MAPTSGSTSATSASPRASSTSCRGGCWHDGTGQAPPRRHGAAQRAARARADPLGSRGADRRGRDQGRLGQEAAAARRRRRAGRARRRAARRGDGGDPARQARAAGGALAVPGRLRADRGGGRLAHRCARPQAGPRRQWRVDRRARLGRAGAVRPARRRARGVPRRRAQGDRRLRAGQGGCRRRLQGARALRLASRRPAARLQPRRHGAAAACGRQAGPGGGRRGRARVDRGGRRGVRVVRAQRRDEARAGAQTTRLRDPAADRDARAGRAPARGRPRRAGGDSAGRGLELRSTPHCGGAYAALNLLVTTAGRPPLFTLLAQTTQQVQVPEGPAWYSWDSISAWLQTWAPIIFMGLLVYFIWRTLKMMPRTKPTEIKPEAKGAIGWAEVAGADEAKAELQEVVEFLRDPRRFAKLGATVPRGILLHGPPGTGKTLLAKAVAHEAGANFYSQSAAAFVEMFAGLGASRIRRLFAMARKERPAIIFIDEIDAVGGERGSDNNSEREQTLNQLLVEMDGFETTNDLVVIAASNLLEKLDPALLRPGRFDRQIFVSPPDVAGREQIMNVHTRGKPIGNVDLGLIARQTSGLTGADLANLCNEAAIFAARQNRDFIAHADFDSALERVVAGMQSRRTLNEHERRVVAFHEAGHALCAELLPGVDRVHKISIVPRGKALGYTLNLPEEDRYLKTKEELLDYMSVLLGGRAAEELVFGSITTGAADDLHRVAEVSRAMVHDYAMGTSITSRKVSAEGGQVSDRTRQLRDEEQQHLSDEALRGAMKLISDHRSKLDQLASALLRNEVLERKDIDRIMEGVPRFHRSPGQGLRVVAAARADAARN